MDVNLGTRNKVSYTVTNAGNVDALCRDLGAGTYVVRLTGDNFEKTDKVIIR